MEFILQFISEELIYALGWTVVHSIWQALLIAIIMALVMQSMQKRSAKLRYEVAGISLFLVFVFSLSTFILLYDGVSQKEFGEITLIAHASSNDAAITGSFFQNTVQSCIDYFNNHLSVIVAIWLIGVTFFFLRLIGGLTYVNRLKYTKNQPLSAYWQKKLTTLSERIPLKKPVGLLESSLIKVPMVIGFFKPVILMPMGAVNGLSESEVEAILAHELGHIFRNDFLMNIVLSVIEVMFYYHPAVWWISANVRLERENCSDDIAIKLCGNSLTYAKALVTLQEMDHHAVPSFAMTFSSSKNKMLNRVKRILNQPQNRSNIMEKLTATCLLLAAIFILSVGANTPFEGKTEIKADEKHRLHFYPEAQNIVVDVILMNDTIPEKRRKERYRVIKEENGEKTEFTMENGEIIELKVNGKVIPEEEFENYEDLVDGIIIDVPEPPAPPVAPEPAFPPVAPVAPSPLVAPAPPVAPTPPNPSFFNSRTTTIRTVTKGKNNNGQTVIVIEMDNGKSPMEIIIEEDGNVIMIDGNELEDGDTAIIIDEYNPRRGYLNVFPRIDGVSVKADKFEFDQDALFGWVEGEKRENVWAFEDPQVSRVLRFEKGQLKKMRKNQDRVYQLHLERLKDCNENILSGSVAIQKLNEKQLKKMEELSGQLAEARVFMEDGNTFLFRGADGEANDFLFETKVLPDNYEFYFEGNGHFQSGNLSTRIEQELIKDGLIESGSDYKLEINDKRIKVNGKKLSDEAFKKYKKLYESASKSKMGKNSRLRINKKDD